MRDVPQFSNCGSGKFREIVSCFLLQPGLPFADVLSAERIERIFQKHRNLFGGEIYSVAVIVCGADKVALTSWAQTTAMMPVAAINFHCFPATH